MGNFAKNQFVLRRSWTHPGVGNTITHEIDKGGFVEDILVIARGNVVVSGGTTSGVATGDPNPEAIVQQFEVIANAAANSPYPDGSLKRVYPRSVKARMLFDEGVLVSDMLGHVLTGDAGTVAVCVPYLLRFALPELKQQNETSLYTDQYAGLQLVITMNALTAMFKGCDRAVDFSGITFDIYDRRTYASPNGQPVAVLFEQDQIVPINGANDSMNLKEYLLKDQPYLDVLMMTEIDNHVLADTVLNQVKLVEDTNSVPFHRAIKPLAYRFMQSVNYVKDMGDAQTGLYLIECAEDGMLSQLVDSPAITVDVANPSGANKDRIILSGRRIVLPTVFLPQKK